MELPTENITSAVQDIVKQEGFVSYEISVSPGCEKGNNFVGAVYKILVTGFNKFGENVTKHLFCKAGTLDKKARESYCLRNFYLREIKIYDEVLTEMKKFEFEKGINCGFTSFAQCFRTDVTEDEEFLLMEDLSERNFVMLAKDIKLDLAHIQLVMKALGKFHALSFALRDQKPKLFQKLSKEMPEEYFNGNLGIKIYNDNFLSRANEMLAFEGVYKEKWEDFCKHFFKFGAECTNGLLAEPYAVVCHGDMWRNNMMFKYEDGEPAEICFIDWQIARYCSPALDVVHYLFSCTDRSFRNIHYNNLLDTYYDSLSNFLKELGSKPEKLFPFSVFQNQLKKFGKFGLIKAIIIIPIICLNRDKINSIREMDSLFTNTKNSEMSVMLKDVVEEMIELDYL